MCIPEQTKHLHIFPMSYDNAKRQFDFVHFDVWGAYHTACLLNVARAL